MGRPRRVGKRLPALKALVENPYTPWETRVVSVEYGQGDYSLQVASRRCGITGLPAVPIRWVLIQDPKVSFHLKHFYVLTFWLNPAKSCWFRQRWQIEVTFAKFELI